MTSAEDGQSRDLERFRKYLRLLAEMQMPARLQKKLEPSDIVQETLLKAVKKLDKVQFANDAQKASWLRTILANVLVDNMRRFATGMRDVNLERSLQAGVENSSACLERLLAAQGESPSAEAIRHEQLLRLADALGQLPEDQRRAVEWMHLHGRSVDEIAEELERTPSAVGGLLRRGMKKLRDMLASNP